MHVTASAGASHSGDEAQDSAVSSPWSLRMVIIAPVVLLNQVADIPSAAPRPTDCGARSYPSTAVV